jgi:hypothetical protein
MRSVTLLCLLLAACDGDDAASGLVSCTISFEGLDFPKGCLEMSESAASEVQQGCRSQTASLPDGGLFTQRGEFAAGPCSRVNALGACRSTETGTTVTTWFYAGGADSGTRETNEDIQRLCEEKGGEFVPP